MSAWPKNCWYVAAWDHEVSADAPFARTILGEEVVLFRDRDGRAAALADRCPHRLAPLSHGRIEGGVLRCMYHGLVFAGSGACIEIPGQERIPPSLSARAYPTVERDRYVWIWMGDPALADPALVAPRPWQDSPAWRFTPGYLKIGADYRLIMDNLLDFSHLAFVHENSLGGPRAIAEIQPVIERFDWGLRVTRWYLGHPMPPYLLRIADFPGPVDRWQVYEWRTAGNLFDMDSGVAPAGTGAPEGKRVAESLGFHNVQSITPETERSSHFFWSYPHDFALHDGNITEALARELVRGFEEDKAIIEAQQAVIDAHPQERMIAIAADAGVMQGRSLLERLIAAEGA